MTATDTHRAIDAVWRIESARIIAGIARLVGDVGLAEENLEPETRVRTRCEAAPAGTGVYVSEVGDRRLRLMGSHWANHL